MKLSTCRRIIIACGSMAFFGALSALGGEVNQGQTAVGLGLAVVCLGIAGTVAALYWRCPHCKTHLGRRMEIPNYCPHCGEKLEKD